MLLDQLSSGVVNLFLDVTPAITLAVTAVSTRLKPKRIVQNVFKAKKKFPPTRGPTPNNDKENYFTYVITPHMEQSFLLNFVCVHLIFSKYFPVTGSQE